MAKKKKDFEIIGWVDEQGQARDTMPDYTSRVHTTSQQSTQPDVIRSVASTIDTLNSIKPMQTQNTITDLQGNVQVLEQPKSNVLDSAKYIGKSGAQGVISALGGITDAPMQNIQEGAEKNKNKSKLRNYIEGAIKTLDIYGITRIPEIVEGTKNILSNPEKSTFSKVTNVAMKNLNNNAVTRGLEASGQQANLVGMDDRDIQNIRDKNVLNRASNILQDELSQERNKQGKLVQTAGDVTQVVSNMLPSMAATAITKNPNIGLAAMGVSAKGQATNEALQRGASLSEANEIGLAKGLTEVATEKITGGLKYFGKGTADELVEKGINKAIKNKAGNFIAKQVAGIGGEVAEETISDLVGTAIDKATVDPNASYSFDDWKKTALMTMLSTGALNTISGGYSKQAYQLNAEELQQIAEQPKVQQTINERVEQLTTPNMTPQEVEEVRQEATEVILGEIQQNVDDILDSSIAQLQEQPQIPTQTPINTLSSNIQEQNNQTPMQEQTPQITPLNQVNQELQETRQNDIANQVQAMNLEQEPQFTQKQGNYVYEKSDNSKIDNLRKDAATYLKEGEQTTNFVNTLEKLVKDKDIEIRFDPNLRDSQGRMANGSYSNNVITLNPNSNRAGEFLAIHELTHAIGTKSMINMIQKYRKSNAEFDSAVKRLLTTYKATEINEEALGDIAGQLFGNQEYINNLSMENPSLFKKIYNEIKYLWHQFTGYKNQDQFIEDLRNKWESAYRNQKVQQKAKNSNIEMSNQTDSNGNMLSNEQVDYFKNSKVRDKNGNLLEVYHGTNSNDFTVFDKTKFNTNESSGDYIGEGFYFTKNKGTASRYGTNIKPAYLKIENPVIINNAQDGKAFRESFDGMYEPTTEEEIRIRNEMRKFDKQYDYFQLKKENPALIREELEKRGYDGLIDNDYGQYAVFNSNQIKNIDNLTPTQDDDIRYSKEETNKDNQGRELSKQQQQFFKDESQEALDENGNIEVMYHTTPNKFTIFDKSKLGDNTAYDNTAFGFFVTPNKDFSNRFGDIDNQGNKSNVMKLYAHITKPITHPYNADYMYSGEELNNIVRDYFNAIDETEGINELESYVEDGDFDNLYEAYMNTMVTDLGTPFEYAEEERNILEKKGYDSVRFIEGDEIGTISEDRGNEPVVSFAVFNPNQIKNVDNLNPTEDPDIRYSKNNQTWREYLEKEFPNQGTRTDLQDINERNKPKQENKTTQEEKPQEMPKKEVKQEVKKSYLTSAEQNELDGLKAVENSGFAELTKEEQARMEELEKKSQGITKKFPELNKTVTQEDTKPLYFKYKDSEISRENNKILNEAKNIVEANNQGRRTKEQWLQVAEYIGSNADIKNSQDLQKLAMETWLASRPNTKDNLNRQGKKYVDFKTNEWFNAMYKGAGVGTDVKMSLEEATDTKGNKVDLKPSGNNTYEQVNVKPKKTDVIPDMSNKVLNIGNEKVSNFYSNITEKSKFITEENREALKDNANLQYYDAITNKETLENAMDKLNKEPEKQVGDFFAKKDFDAEDVATGWILVKRYQDAGNYEAMTNVIEKMREQGTKAGQTVQAYGILQRLTPEGMEYYSQKQLDKAFNEFSKNKSKKQIEKYANDFTLTAEEHQFIKDTMEKVQNMTDEEQKKVEIAKIVSMLSDKMPPSKGQRIKAWMRIAMLGNPKTQVRNVMGNAIIQPVNWVGDVFSATADKLISKKTGVRTKGTTDFGALVQGTKKGFKDSVRDAKTGVDTRDINLNRFEENIGAKPFYEGHKGKAGKVLNAGAKVLNKTNKILSNVMSGGDRIFYQGVYENSLQNQMKLNKVDTPTQEMIDIATQEALQRTWNDSNEYTKAVLTIRNAMNKLNVKGYGLGDVLVPFAKTPANLTKAIVDYSPIGLTRSILQDGKNLKNSLQNGQYNAQLQHKFADSLGKGFAGSLLYLTAYALAQAGITSGASDDDKDVANFMRNTLGIQPYSVKVGDKSFTYDWAQPLAAPFAMMADIEGKKKNTKDEQDLLSYVKTAGNTGLNILLDQSFLSSIQDVFNSYDGPGAAIQQQVQDLPARATPTFFKQIADMVDPTQRQTFVKGDEGQTLKNKVQVKIPGASKELTAQRDTLGREIKKYGGDEDKLKYAFNVFLNPANTNKGKPSKAAEEIYAVYKATGDKTVMPRQVGYSENIGGTTRNLTAKERNEWQKLSGEKIEENVKALTSNSKYNAMSDEDKAAVINGIVNYSFAKAKSDLFDTNISTMYKTAAKKEEQGIPLYDYYIDRISKRR